MKSQRQSNIELLRIVSIAMVLAVHIDGASLGLPQPNGAISSMTGGDWWRLIVESLTIIGVNCFTLISGYFGIKASWRGLLNLTVTCLFYSLGIYLGLVITGMTQWEWNGFADAIMIYSHTDLWYVPAYLGVYLLSPILNAAARSLDRRQMVWTLGGFIAFNLYCGWLWGASFNPTGYTIIQLIMVYLIGQYLGRYGMPSAPSNRHTYLLIYILASAAITAQTLYCDPLWAFAYNSPLVLLSSVSFFMWFTTMNISSKAINTLATSAFAVYLLHKNPYIWGGIIKPFSLWLWEHLSLWQFTAAALVLIVLIYLFTFLIDRLRISIVSKLQAKTAK